MLRAQTDTDRAALDLKSSNLDLGRKLPTGTFDDTCQRQVHQWLTTCCEFHSTCNEDWRTTQEFPIRLLNVSPELGEHIILEQFELPAKRQKYVTMSHCWDTLSDTLFTHLTTENVSIFEDGLPVKQLPTKFRDAVHIARWMKVDYLWIDALCIMQDSNDDWQKQSKVMGDIYAGSLCNIAAMIQGEDEGCLRERKVEIVEPHCIPNPARSSKTETHVIGYDDFWCNSLLSAKLHTRGWVLQERLLSPRTVHFGEEQIYFECRVLKACEAYPEGIPEQFSNHRTKAWREGEQVFNPKSRTMGHDDSRSVSSMSTSDSLGGNTTQMVKIPSHEAYSFWSHTVERYMGCDISYASDKLLAIAGLARKVQETTKEQYLAGMWYNDDLPQSLLWFVPASKQTDGRQSIRYPSAGRKGYRAPSWSWASIDGSITWIWPTPCNQVLVEVLDAYAQPAGDNPVGAVKFAQLTVRGMLIPVRLDVMHRHEDGSMDEDGSYLLTSRPGRTLSHRSAWEEDCAVRLTPLVYLDRDLAEPSADAFFLPICTQWTGRTGRLIAAVAGLLLRGIHTRGGIAFERFGLVGLDNDGAHQLCGFDSSSLQAQFDWFDVARSKLTIV